MRRIVTVVIMIFAIASTQCTDKSTQPKNEGPVGAAVADQTIAEGREFTIRWTGTDADDTILTLTVVNAPTNATFVDSGNGAASFAFAPDSTQGGTYNVQFVVSDGTSADTVGFTITVNDLGPAGKLYVLNQGDGTLYIYSTESLERIDSVDVATNPHYIEFSPDGSHYFVVSLEGLGRISKYSAATNALVADVATPPQTVPSSIAITPDNMFGYVSNFTGRTSPTERTKILKYDLSTMSLVSDNIQAGAVTHDLKITSNGENVVASNRLTDDVTVVHTDADTIAMVSIDPDSLYPPGTKKYGPFGVLIDRNDETAYIACVDAFQVRVLDLATRSIVDSIDIPVTPSQIGGTISGPTLMTIAPDNDLLFVTTQRGNSVVAVRFSTKQVVADIPVSANRTFGIAMNGDGTRVYVACVNRLAAHGRVYVIDATANPPVKIDSLDVGNQSFGLSWQPM